MREIKFRAYDKIEQIICNVETISFENGGCFLIGNSPTKYVVIDDKIYQDGDDNGHFVKFENLEMM